MQKNSRLVAEEARRGGITSPLIEECDQLFTETLNGGHGALDMVGYMVNTNSLGKATLTGTYGR